MECYKPGILPIWCALIITCFASCSKRESTEQGSQTGELQKVEVIKPPQNIYPDSNFRSICIDNIGNIWLAAKDGLLRYDGSNWKYFNSSNTPVSFGVVGTVRCDRDGWVYATVLNDVNGGKADLITNKNNTWTSYRLPFGVDKFEIDKSSNTFQFNGTIIYKGNGDYSNSSSYDNHKLDIAGNSELSDVIIHGNTFFGAVKYEAPYLTSRGGGVIIQPFSGVGALYYYNPVTPRIIMDNIGTQDGNTLYVFGHEEDMQFSLLKKLYVFRNGNWNIIPYGSADQKLEIISKIAFDKDGCMWICDIMDGFVKFEDGKFTSYEIDGKFPSVYDVAVDSKNVKWFASGNRGLLKCSIE